MKLCSTLVFAVALSSQAALVQFNISPSGTDAAVGLSPSNQVPAVTNSTGSGDAISGGIVLDTETSVFAFAIGYGSAAGFSDLSGAPTAMHIHGPAAAGHNASPIIDLAPFNFQASNPALGGVIVGTILFPTNSVSNLLAGLTYVNIHTALNPDGEIRGQLIPAIVSNGPLTISCSAASTNECGTPAVVSVLVSDPDGDPMTVVWSANGMAFKTNTVPAGAPGASVSLSANISLPLGTNTVTVTTTDTVNNTASCSTIVTVVDTIPPVITHIAVSPATLWPPNHKMVRVQVRADVMDICGPTTWKIISVTSNESPNSQGDGNTASDWAITGDHTVSLRAERSGRGNGRIYTITIQATDAAGNVSDPKSVTVTVPHSQGRG
jgi:CHRD domain